MELQAPYVGQVLHTSAECQPACEAYLPLWRLYAAVIAAGLLICYGFDVFDLLIYLCAAVIYAVVTPQAPVVALALPIYAFGFYSFFVPILDTTLVALPETVVGSRSRSAPRCHSEGLPPLVFFLATSCSHSSCSKLIPWMAWLGNWLTVARLSCGHASVDPTTAADHPPPELNPSPAELHPLSAACQEPSEACQEPSAVCQETSAACQEVPASCHELFRSACG